MFDHFPGLDWPTPYGVMLALAGVAAWWFARRRACGCGLDASHIDLVLPLFFACGAGANLLIAVAVPQEQLLAGQASLAEESLRMPVLVLAALPILFAYCRMVDVSARRLADAIVPATLVAVAIGYVGCFLAGCCFGDIAGSHAQLAALADPQLRLQVQTVPALSPDGLPWAVRFPAGSFAYRQQLALGLIEPGAVATLPVHPVQLYESAAALLLCFGAVRLQPAFRGQGTLALATFAAYAALAFGLQFLRADSALVLGPLTATQFIYLAWLATALPLALFTRSRNEAASGR
jgi:phosphatidylglycerol:prolipoprotein diacylglycerol transferase